MLLTLIEDTSLPPRQWISPTKSVQPTVYYTKHMMARLKADRFVSQHRVCSFRRHNSKAKILLIRPVLVACDLHGHSRKSNIFM